MPHVLYGWMGVMEEQTTAAVEKAIRVGRQLVWKARSAALVSAPVATYSLITEPRQSLAWY